MRVKCVQCQKFRNRVRKNKLFYSALGALWQSSKVCNKCYIINIRGPKYSNLLGPELPVYYTDKLCNKCTGRLELSRYKTCTICKPSLGDDYELIQGNTIWETPDFRISEMSLLAGG